mgnify:CR=1 FL=1
MKKNSSLEKKHLSNDEIIFDFIKKNPGLSFRQIRFRLEMNEGVLNNNLKSLIKHDFIEKRSNLTYFAK